VELIRLLFHCHFSQRAKVLTLAIIIITGWSYFTKRRVTPLPTSHPRLFMKAVMSYIYKWPAVAAQTAWSRCKVLSIQYAYYFRAYQRQWNGRQIIRWEVRKLDHTPVAKTLVILCKLVSKCMSAWIRRPNRDNASRNSTWRLNY